MLEKYGDVIIWSFEFALEVTNQAVLAKYKKQPNTPAKAMLQISDILMRSENLKTAAKNNSEEAFAFSCYTGVDDALIEGLDQYRDFLRCFWKMTISFGPCGSYSQAKFTRASGRWCNVTRDIASHAMRYFRGMRLETVS